MKYIILLGDGMSDYPIRELGGKTPLQVAKTPNLDFIAREGIVGIVRTIPEGMDPGSDVGTLSVLGYDPKTYYTGRAPLEAASIGVNLEPSDVAFRCHLVTIKNGIMDDYSAGHIKTEDAKKFIEEVNNQLSNDEIKFYPGKSYRHLMVWKNGKNSLKLTPPHAISGKRVIDYLPKGDGAEKLKELMEKSQALFDGSKLNIIRIEKNEKPVTSIWFWGNGKKPLFKTFKERFGKTGAVISAVDLIKGIAVYLGFDRIEVPGATGYLDTNYEGKAEYALKALKERDFIYLHVEAPDEAGHNGDLKAKIKAIEDFDAKVVGAVLAGIKEHKKYKVMALPDHPTPLSLRDHSGDPVPFAIYSSNGKKDGAGSFDEEEAKNGSKRFEEGHKLMEYFLGSD